MLRQGESDVRSRERVALYRDSYRRTALGLQFRAVDPYSRYLPHQVILCLRCADKGRLRPWISAAGRQIAPGGVVVARPDRTKIAEDGGSRVGDIYPRALTPCACAQCGGGDVASTDDQRDSQQTTNQPLREAMARGGRRL